MRFHVFFSTIVLVTMSSNLYAQHSDIEFGYDDLGTPTAFVIEQDKETLEGFQIFESEMEELDPSDPGNFSSDEPGFATNFAEGLLVNEDDEIWLRALNAPVHSSFGVGYVNYYNPVLDTLQAFGEIEIRDERAGTDHLVLSGATYVSGANPQFIGLGDEDGDIHDHVTVDLVDDSTPLGAYGILFQLQSDFASADGTTDLNSDPFWIIWNHGMDESDFDNFALPKFGFSSVPEPGSIGLLAIGLVALISRRRKQG